MLKEAYVNPRLTIDAITVHLDIVKRLEDSFDFIISCDAAADSDNLFVLRDDMPHHPFAKSGAGDIFTFCPVEPDGHTPVLYVTSEGRADVIAGDLYELMQIMVALPYWGDLLKFSGGGQLEAMRKAAMLLEEEYLDDDLDYAKYRETISTKLRLEPLPDPVATLYNNVRAYEGRIIAESPEGDTFETLFNTFTYSGWLR